MRLFMIGLMYWLALLLVGFTVAWAVCSAIRRLVRREPFFISVSELKRIRAEEEQKEKEREEREEAAKRLTFIEEKKDYFRSFVRPNRSHNYNRYSSRSNSRHYGGTMQAGQEGEERVKRILQQLSFPNTVINDKFIDNINSVKDAQIDHFVISEKGIVMIETKNYAGEIDMTDEKQWIQTIPSGERRACTNAYYQSVTHYNIMRNLMKKHGFGDIRIYAIVVFANDRTIYHGLDKDTYHGYVMKYDAMNYYLTGLPACKAMKDKQRRNEVIQWIRSFKDADSYDQERNYSR